MSIPVKSIYPTVTFAPMITTTSTTTGPKTPSYQQREHPIITANIPREVTFELPEGRYRATFSGIRPLIKQANQGAHEWIRMLFEVHIPGLSEQYDACAGRNFKLDLNPGSDLRNWLTGLLGKDFFRDRSGQQMNLDSLLGTECEVELKHFYGKGYDKPLVVVAGIHPVRSSQPTQATGGKD